MDPKQLHHIVSFTGNPRYNPASFYKPVMSENITPPTLWVKNSFEFIQKIRFDFIGP